LPGGRTFAFDINDSGLAVGMSVVGGLEHAFAWQGSSRRELDPLAGDNASGVGGVNSAGQIVGYSALLFGSTPRVRAVMWQPNSSEAIDLGVVDDSHLSYGLAINDLGMVAGYYTSLGGSADAYEWQSDIVDTLFRPAGSCCAFADALNNAGVAVGSVRSGCCDDVPVKWDASGALSYLPMLKRGTTGAAAGINSSGLVAGWSTFQASPNPHAVLWRKGHAIDLGTLPEPDLDSSYASAINDQGQVVGTSAVGPDDPVYGIISHATLWEVKGLAAS
jgi:probable HAF family extracellular repeat protein